MHYQRTEGSHTAPAPFLPPPVIGSENATTPLTLTESEVISARLKAEKCQCRNEYLTIERNMRVGACWGTLGAWSSRNPQSKLTRRESRGGRRSGSSGPRSGGTGLRGQLRPGAGVGPGPARQPPSLEVGNPVRTSLTGDERGVSTTGST